MTIDRPIITSILDDDFYKFSMGQVVFHNFPDLMVRYKFINRGKTQFPPGFAEALKDQIRRLSEVKLTMPEQLWMRGLPYFRPTYIDWFCGYRYNEYEIDIRQNGGDLEIDIAGYWYRTIFWEVKLMAIISELYFTMTGTKMADDWMNRIEEKNFDLEENGCFWSDFGTRRRFSLRVQDVVVNIMKHSKGFVGTSNPYLAFRNGVKPVGTSAHEAVMAMECLYGAHQANIQWLKTWRDFYKDQLSVALTDTFTTDVFFRGLGSIQALQWQGFRQDSGKPKDWADNKVLPFLNRMGIAPSSKTTVFSDNLNVPKFIDLSLTYRNVFKMVMGGIGTNLSNDVLTPEQTAAGIKPLNMVIKLSQVKIGDKWVGAVKLSDDAGKHTGTAEDIQRVKANLGL